jgi:CheY-like chemotaxis protein
VPEKPSEPTPEVSSSEPAENGDFTIFVVEDDEAVRGLVTEILSHHGYRVIDASSGDAALKLWPEIREEVDVLLTDMVMPGKLSGLDLARKLTTDRSDLLVIYTSGYSRELFSGEVPLEEGRNYLPKPYLTAKLLAIIRRASEGKKPRLKT